jgi:hypothetical protein
MLGEFLTPILEEKSPDDMLIQQDGTPSHFHKEVTDFLHRKFPEKWIGRGGPVNWPPRSPDLTPLDFFLLGVHQGCNHRLPLCWNLLGG